MATIVHAADVTSDIDTSLKGYGLLAIAHGVSLLFGKDDSRKLELEFPLYDALYTWCEAQETRL